MWEIEPEIGGLQVNKSTREVVEEAVSEGEEEEEEDDLDSLRSDSEEETDDEVPALSLSCDQARKILEMNTMGSCEGVQLTPTE